MSYQPIENYGIIGNMRTVAHVGMNGSIDVCAALYEPRAFGVHSVMPAVSAERLCPAAISVTPDFTRYRAVSKSMREIFKCHTDLIEPLSLERSVSGSDREQDRIAHGYACGANDPRADLA